MNFEGDRVYYTDQNLINGEVGIDGAMSYADTENKFMHFVRETQIGNTYIYRE